MAKRAKYFDYTIGDKRNISMSYFGINSIMATILITQRLLALLVLTLLLLAVFIIYGATAHGATKTANVGVSVTVQTICTAGTNVSGNISFGTLNFGNYSALSQSITAVGSQNAGALSVQCSAGVNYKIVMNSGSNSATVNNRYMLGSGTNKINYNLYTDSGFQTIWDNVNGVSRTATGLQEWVPVYGRVPSQTTPAAGTYSDSVQVTVSW